MRAPVVLMDTGPLIALLSPESPYHEWTKEQWRRMRPPVLCCEPVLTEAAFLVKREKRDADAVFEMVEQGALRVGLHVEGEVAELRALMRRYRERPMSLADACVVRLSEIHTHSEVFTLDADFRVYRRHGNRTIPVLMPPA